MISLLDKMKQLTKGKEKLKKLKNRVFSRSKNRGKLQTADDASSSPVASALGRIPTPASQHSNPAPVPTEQLCPTASVTSCSTLARGDSEPWALAFRIFRSREPQLAADYQKHLASVQDKAERDVDLSVPQSVECMVKQLLEEREKKQWRVPLLNHDIKIRAQAEKLVKFLLWSDPIVKAAVGTQPYAALAWCGVTLILPLLISGTSQNEAMQKGLTAIGDLQVYWNICETTYLESPQRQYYQDMAQPLVKLYSYIIEYQARVICHLSQAQLSRAWQHVTGWNDWDAKATMIRELSDSCTNCIPHLEKQEIRNRWGEQLEEIRQSRTSLDEIRQILEQGRRQTQTIYEDKRERSLLQDLASNYEGYKDFNPPRVEGTCEWFFKDNIFHQWRDSNTSSLLWVSAGPGCGKSVLSRALIDESRLSANLTTSNVCYFFFKDGDTRRMRSTDALCAILHQLFHQDLAGTLLRIALPSHKAFGKTLTTNFSELWKILMACVRSSAAEVICVLDALDECEIDSRGEFIDHVKKFYADQQDRPVSSKLRFLITSRPYDNLEIYFSEFTTTNYLRFEGDDRCIEISREIDLVIDARLSEITGGFTVEDQHKLCQRLKSMEHRTYLWLHLTLDIIKRRPAEYGRRCDIEELLSTLPNEVSQAYEKILNRSENQERTEILLQIMLAAARPLTLDEANCALTLALERGKCESHVELESKLWPRQKFQSIVTNLCGLFVNVHNSRLSFIHQTAREFLLESRQQAKWQGRFNLEISHSTISSVCIRYLLLRDLEQPEEGPDNRFLFIRYAAENWPLHYNSQEDAIAEKSIKDARILCNMDGDRGNLWRSLSSKSRYFTRGQLSDLALATQLDLRLVVKHILLTEKADVNQSLYGIYSTALHIASEEGHRDIVQLLLMSGADINADSYCGTALQIASEEGHQEIVQLLIDNGADINAHSCSGTALQIASKKGHQKIAQLLIDNGADVSANNASGAALHIPSAKGHLGLMQLVGELNAKPEGWVGTTLHLASQKGDQETIQFLLDNGADPNADSFEGTSLQIASELGHRGIAKLLLDNGADANVHNEIPTPLQQASKAGHREIVQLLLDNGADPDANSKECDATALHLASGMGHAHIVQLLLDHGANANAESGTPGTTTLEEASTGGHQETIPLLISNGANTKGRNEAL